MAYACTHTYVYARVTRGRIPTYLSLSASVRMSGNASVLKRNEMNGTVRMHVCITHMCAIVSCSLRFVLQWIRVHMYTIVHLCLVKVLCTRMFKETYKYTEHMHIHACTHVYK